MYFCLDLQNVSHEAEEWLSHAAFDWDAQGMSEVLSYHQEEGEEAVETVPSETHQIHVYFEKVPNPEFLQEIKLRYPEIKWQLLEAHDQDWLAEWKKGFHPFELVNGTYIVPSWLKAPAEAREVIWMEPGMAFGTGTHETTQLVSRALAKIEANPAATDLLDIGTGTGILAILADKMGYRSAVGIDTDVEALRVARENAERNESKIHVSPNVLEQLDGKFGVVLANIIDGILVRIQQDIFSHLKPGGWLIVSGILEEREKFFESNFHLPAGATWTAREQKGDWVCRVAHFPKEN